MSNNDDLLKKIRTAQIRAGEEVVINNLRERGLITPALQSATIVSIGLPKSTPGELEILKKENERLNKELDIVHTYLTELYNYQDNKVGDIVKRCLDQIEKECPKK